MRRPKKFHVRCRACGDEEALGEGDFRTRNTHGGSETPLKRWARTAVSRPLPQPHSGSGLPETGILGLSRDGGP